MDNLTVGILGVVAVLSLIAIRVQVGVVLGLVAFVGISVIATTSAAWGILASIPQNFVAQWSLSAIPMFLLMGYIASQCGLTSGLFASARILLGRVPGGLASSTVVASALFASTSGSSVATAAAFARIAVPEMLKANYKPSLATGCVAAAGTLGSLIPPSILMILYGIFTNTSIGAIFLAGILPGILSAAAYILMITVRAWRDPSLAPSIQAKASRSQIRAALLDIWPLPLLIAAVLGSIFTGIATPTEAAALGALVALAIAASRRSLSWLAIRKALVDTAEGTCTVLIIAVGAVMFSTFMGLSGLPNAFAALLLEYVDSVIGVILVVAVLYIILGMFVESASIMLLTIPVLQPILNSLGVDMIWFGIIVIKLLEIGMITPPVGMNVFVIRSALGRTVKLASVFKGATWFIVTDLVTLGLIIAFPAIALYLPTLMMK